MLLYVVGYCYLLQVDVAEHQLLVAAVDDGGPVAAGEHVTHGAVVELAEDSGLVAEDNLIMLNKLVKFHFLLILYRISPLPYPKVFQTNSQQSR